MRNYVNSIEIAQENFLHAMETYFDTGKCCPDFEFLVAETHKAESKSDDIQQKISLLLFEKALIPEFRGDILTLLETIDDIPDQFDRVLYNIQTQKIEMQNTIKLDFKELVTVSLESCTLTMGCVKELFKRQSDPGKILSKVDQLESHGDHIERRIIIHIFDSDWDPLQKILLRDLAFMLGDIADHAVHVCRQINLITIKRRV